MKYKVYTKSGQLLGKEYFINQDGELYHIYSWYSEFHGNGGTTINKIDINDYIIEMIGVE